MMNEEMDNFESRLQARPVKRIPAAWRSEILAAAQKAGTARRDVRGQRSALSLSGWLSSLFWPHPKAWAGLAAVWVCIFLLNFSTRDKTPVMAQKYTPPSPAMVAELKQQKLMYAELMGTPELRVADRPKNYLPKPQSKWAEIFKV